MKVSVDGGETGKVIAQSVPASTARRPASTITLTVKH